jgi:hypothetical protein
MSNDRSKDQDDIEIMRSVADMADRRPLLAGGPSSLIQMRVASVRIREARQALQSQEDQLALVLRLGQAYDDGVLALAKLGDLRKEVRELMEDATRQVSLADPEKKVRELMKL